MTKSTKKLAKKIAAEFKNLRGKTPAEQMAAYFTIGEYLMEAVAGDEVDYGSTPVLDLAMLVPDLKSEESAYRLLCLARCAEDVREFILEETAHPMSNGQHLTPTHWSWLRRHQPQERSAEEEGMPRHGIRTTRHKPVEESVDGSELWLLRELAWLRKESPSAAALDHIEEILEAEYEREMDRLRESVRDAARALNAL